jgi:hypothetical protein
MESSSTQFDSSNLALQLDSKRRSLEAEAQAITDELTQPIIDEHGNRSKPMGVDTPLVDEEGYPRSDIDIYRTRDLRKRLNQIRYDHKVVMKQIEDQLLISNVVSSSTTHTQVRGIDDDELKARKAPKPKPKFDKKTGKWVVCNWDGSVAGVENGHLRSFNNLDSDIDEHVDCNTNNQSSHSAVDSESLDNGNSHSISNSLAQVNIGASSQLSTSSKPFAKINEIHEFSPAAKSGLKLNDIIVMIGPINYENHRDLQAVAEVVQRAFINNDTIDFLIERESEKVSVKVKPGYWSGNGILGCRIVKI